VTARTIQPPARSAAISWVATSLLALVAAAVAAVAFVAMLQLLLFALPFLRPGLAVNAWDMPWPIALTVVLVPAIVWAVAVRTAAIAGSAGHGGWRTTLSILGGLVLAAIAFQLLALSVPALRFGGLLWTPSALAAALLAHAIACGLVYALRAPLGLAQLFPPPGNDGSAPAPSERTQLIGLALWLTFLGLVMTPIFTIPMFTLFTWGGWFLPEPWLGVIFLLPYFWWALLIAGAHLGGRPIATHIAVLLAALSLGLYATLCTSVLLTNRLAGAVEDNGLGLTANWLIFTALVALHAVVMLILWLLRGPLGLRPLFTAS
jgi:hypothetical protein